MTVKAIVMLSATSVSPPAISATSTSALSKEVTPTLPDSLPEISLAVTSFFFAKTVLSLVVESASFEATWVFDMQAMRAFSRVTSTWTECGVVIWAALSARQGHGILA